MREIRQSGSEGGGPQPNAASLPLFLKCPFGAGIRRSALTCVQQRGVAAGPKKLFYSVWRAPGVSPGVGCAKVLIAQKGVYPGFAPYASGGRAWRRWA